MISSSATHSTIGWKRNGGDDFPYGDMGTTRHAFTADTALGNDTIPENADSEGGVDTLDFSAPCCQWHHNQPKQSSLQIVNANLSPDAYQ